MRSVQRCPISVCDVLAVQNPVQRMLAGTWGLPDLYRPECQGQQLHITQKKYESTRMHVQPNVHPSFSTVYRRSQNRAQAFTPGLTTSDVHSTNSVDLNVHPSDEHGLK